MFELGADMSSEAVKGKIIVTTIECIEMYGISNLTIRKLAEEANVNVAAVNYHFGSKDKLIAIALDVAINEGFVNNINDYEELWMSNPIQAFRFFLTDTLCGSARYPGITRAILSEPFNNGNMESPIVARLNGFLGNLYTKVVDIMVGDDESEKRLNLTHIFNNILINAMLPNIYREFTFLDIQKTQAQEQIINSLLSTYTKEKK